MHDTNTPAWDGVCVADLLDCERLVGCLCPDWRVLRLRLGSLAKPESRRERLRCCFKVRYILWVVKPFAPSSSSESRAGTVALCRGGCVRGLLLSLWPPFASADRSRATAAARFSPSRPNGALPSLQTSSVGLAESVADDWKLFSWSFVQQVQTKQRQKDSPSGGLHKLKSTQSFFLTAPTCWLFAKVLRLGPGGAGRASTVSHTHDFVMLSDISTATPRRPVRALCKEHRRGNKV